MDLTVYKKISVKIRINRLKLKINRRIDEIEKV